MLIDGAISNVAIPDIFTIVLCRLSLIGAAKKKRKKQGEWKMFSPRGGAVWRNGTPCSCGPLGASGVSAARASAKGPERCPDGSVRRPGEVLRVYPCFARK